MKIIVFIFCLIPLVSCAQEHRDSIFLIESELTSVVSTTTSGIFPVADFIDDDCAVATYIGGRVGHEFHCRLPDKPDFPVITIFNDGGGTVFVYWYNCPFAVVLWSHSFQQFIFDGSTWSPLPRLKVSDSK